MITHNSENRVVCAVHEAAHVTAALAMDIDVVRAQIGDEPGIRTRHPVHPHADVKAAFAAKAGVVALAGPIGELLFTGQRYHTAWQADMANSERYAAQFLRLKNGLAADAAIENAEDRIGETLDRWRMRAQQVLEDNWAHVCAVAAALVQDGSLTGQQIRALLSEQPA